eukprot:351253-Chlamydomonas_euryale.AAC.1
MPSPPSICLPHLAYAWTTTVTLQDKHLAIHVRQYATFVLPSRQLHRLDYHLLLLLLLRQRLRLRRRPERRSPGAEDRARCAARLVLEVRVARLVKLAAAQQAQQPRRARHRIPAARPPRRQRAQHVTRGSGARARIEVPRQRPLHVVAVALVERVLQPRARREVARRQQQQLQRSAQQRAVQTRLLGEPWARQRRRVDGILPAASSLALGFLAAAAARGCGAARGGNRRRRGGHSTCRCSGGGQAAACVPCRRSRGWTSVVIAA